jgi:hypothetical protein
VFGMSCVYYAAVSWIEVAAITSSKTTHYLGHPIKSNELVYRKCVDLNISLYDTISFTVLTTMLWFDRLETLEWLISGKSTVRLMLCISVGMFLSLEGLVVSLSLVWHTW